MTSTLRNIRIPKKEVTLGDGQQFTVKGLSPNDVFGIYFRHRGDLEEMFGQFAGKTDVKVSEVMRSLEGMIAQFPLVCAEAIAISSGANPFDDEPVAEDIPLTNWQADLRIAFDLPLPVQIDALMKIGELTFSPDMPPKKFFGLLVGMMQQANQTPTLETGSDD